MIVKALIPNVNTNAELAALSGIVNQEFAWHNGENCAYMFRDNVASGDVQGIGGWWVKDSIIQGLNLAEYKAYRIEQINTKTGELVALGYTYKGYTFPLSSNAQDNLLGMITAKDYLTYPINLNNIDDTAIYQIQNVADLTNLYLTALATKKARLDSGTALKSQINAAVDELAVSQIIDNR